MSQCHHFPYDISALSSCKQTPPPTSEPRRCHCCFLFPWQPTQSPQHCPQGDDTRPLTNQRPGRMASPEEGEQSIRHVTTVTVTTINLRIKEGDCCNHGNRMAGEGDKIKRNIKIEDNKLKLNQCVSSWGWLCFVCSVVMPTLLPWEPGRHTEPSQNAFGERAASRDCEGRRSSAGSLSSSTPAKIKLLFSSSPITCR